ncbi:50S ribosomal protein L24 [Calycomorphotria hydatis]|uniref:Large ribosomal subunit protein uL24 n=1 Tax=Calycomorphotria hydatis TaxID=2528027 RepID=A0A517T8D2_9PLAN|nr:50S ribosomal protein L24 [Calycomorphotria hydatis]QDT64598.1 50S ribosomal protein L24 [Calycomorphotria hydatis]
MKIRKGDSVLVTTGDDAGSTPRTVISVHGDEDKIVVQGVSMSYKHVKRGHPKSPQGGRLHIEKPISVSNVMYYCPSCNKPSRLGYRLTDEGAKERFCKSCNASAGEVSPAKKKPAATA